MNGTEKISIIVPVYNCERFLEKNIESIVNQSYDNIEIIFINDGSIDKSESILEKYKNIDNRIIIINQKNQGVSKARNVGIEKSTGKYICFVDSDDWIEKDAIQEMYNCIKTVNEPIVRANFVLEYNNNTMKSNEKIKYKECMEYDNNRIIEKLVSGEMFGYIWLLMIDADILKGKIFFDENMYMMEDTIFYIDLLKNNNKIYFLDKILYHYVVNQESASRNIKYYKRNYDVSLSMLENFKIKLGNLFNNNIKYEFNIRLTNSVVGMMYKVFKYDRKNLKRFYLETINNKMIIDSLSMISLDRINKKNKIVLQKILKKQYYRMYITLYFRYQCARIKNLFKQC